MRYVVREKFFRLGGDNDILDEAGQPVLRVDGRALSLRDLMVVYDLNGAEVARVTRKLISMLPRYEVVFPNGSNAEVKKEFSPLHQRWTISVNGVDTFELRGNFLQHDYTFHDGGSSVAVVSKKWVSLTATYGVDVAPGGNDLLVLCTVLALEAEQTHEDHGGNHPAGFGFNI